MRNSIECSKYRNKLCAYENPVAVDCHISPIYSGFSYTVKKEKTFRNTQIKSPEKETCN